MKGTKVCKICGKKYEYCHTVRQNPNIFRWQDVACCPEHGSEYLAKIIASRTKAAADETPKKPLENTKAKEPVAGAHAYEIEVDDDDEDEGCDEDDEE